MGSLGLLKNGHGLTHGVAKMVSYRVRVTDLGEVETELIDWRKEAYDAG